MDDRVLHLALAPSVDALQARAHAATPTTPTSAFPGRRRLHQRQRHRLEFGQRRHLQLYDSSDFLGDQPRILLGHSLGHIERAKSADLRRRDLRASCSGSPSSTQSWRPASPSSSAAACRSSIFASRRSRRTSASTSRAFANTASRSRFSRARIGRSSGPGRCSTTCSARSGASSMCARGSSPSISFTARSPSSFPTSSSPPSIT